MNPNDPTPPNDRPPSDQPHAIASTSIVPEKKGNPQETKEHQPEIDNSIADRVSNDDRVQPTPIAKVANRPEPPPVPIAPVYSLPDWIGAATPNEKPRTVFKTKLVSNEENDDDYYDDEQPHRGLKSWQTLWIVLITFFLLACLIPISFLAYVFIKCSNGFK